MDSTWQRETSLVGQTSGDDDRRLDDPHLPTQSYLLIDLFNQPRLKAFEIGSVHVEQLQFTRIEARWALTRTAVRMVIAKSTFNN